ncbi:MAG: hypothetical protein A2Y94_00990 [Caldithrix sp. RBG_13_44_9]|nr:MAG: hypothetical protein A2Y94_00990 [Caldithrix sp. RBG_13_44_9]
MKYQKLVQKALFFNSHFRKTYLFWTALKFYHNYNFRKNTGVAHFLKHFAYSKIISDKIPSGIP